MLRVLGEVYHFGLRSVGNSRLDELGRAKSERARDRKIDRERKEDSENNFAKDGSNKEEIWKKLLKVKLGWIQIIIFGERVLKVFPEQRSVKPSSLFPSVTVPILSILFPVNEKSLIFRLTIATISWLILLEAGSITAP